MVFGLTNLPIPDVDITNVPSLGPNFVERYNLIASGDGLVNPLQPIISETQANIEDLLGQFGSGGTNPPGSLTPAEIMSVTGALVNLQTSTNTFLDHTNSQSGAVDFNPNSSTPHLMQLSSLELIQLSWIMC